MRILAVIRKALIMQFRDYWALLLTILSAPFFIFVYYLMTGGASTTYSVAYSYEDTVDTATTRTLFVNEFNNVR
jgi:hypothetical protein